MDMPEDVSSTFYATAVADGNVEINGPLDDISITIDAETMQGTTIDIVLTGTNTINLNVVGQVNGKAVMSIMDNIALSNLNGMNMARGM